MKYKGMALLLGTTFFGSNPDLRCLLTNRNELLPLVYPHRNSENNSLSRDNKFGNEAKLEPIGETRQRAHAGPEAIAEDTPVSENYVFLIQVSAPSVFFHPVLVQAWRVFHIDEQAAGL
jgi:hypothetical protein